MAGLSALPEFHRSEGFACVKTGAKPQESVQIRRSIDVEPEARRTQLVGFQAHGERLVAVSPG